MARDTIQGLAVEVEGIKKDTMDFFEEHLTTQKYVDVARDRASTYEW